MDVLVSENFAQLNFLVRPRQITLFQTGLRGLLEGLDDLAGQVRDVVSGKAVRSSASDGSLLD